MHVPKDSGLLSESRIVIVGGTGRMGQLLAVLLKGGGRVVSLYSRDSRRARRVSKGLGVRACTLQEICDADYVIVSVPIRDIVNVSRRLMRRMKRRSALIEASSVKTGVVDRIKRALPQGMEYLSIHPLFGHGVERVDGESVLLVDGVEGPLTNSFITLLRERGLTILRMGVEDHDREMAGIQVMHHFALLCLVVSLAKKGIGGDPRLHTRSYRKTLDSMRMMEGNLPTILEIQEYNPYAEWAREEFKKNAEWIFELKDLTRVKIGEYIKYLTQASPKG